jgi:hypothetical protein
LHPGASRRFRGRNGDRRFGRGGRDAGCPSDLQCKDGKSIDATFYADKVEHKLSDGRSLSLPQAMSASGARYANKDESFVFWNKGNTAFITEGALGTETYSDCLTKVTPLAVARIC